MHEPLNPDYRDASAVALTTDPNRLGWTERIRIPVILWSLLLLSSLLALLAAGPRTAPPYETLTEFTCKQVPVFTATRNASTILQTIFTCRNGNQVIYSQGMPLAVGSYAELKDCLKGSGTLALWRQPMPSPYGRNTFQAACNGKLYADYEALAANYNNTQLFIRIVAWAIVILSAWRLGLYAWHRIHWRRMPQIS